MDCLLGLIIVALFLVGFGYGCWWFMKRME